MQPDSEDDAWRSIVDNFGDRVELGPSDPGSSTPPSGRADWVDDWPDDDGPGGGGWDDERFVPPPPPPLPQVTPDRMVAWLGIFGAPAVLLTALVLGLRLPGWLGYLLVAGFVGGFVYLVAVMPHGPRDPGDDGARL